MPRPQAPKIGAILTTRGDRVFREREGAMAPTRMAFSFTRLRFFSSPSGHMWQCAQLCAFRQPPGLWNQAHGRHVPVPCRAEPSEGNCPEEDTEEAPAGVTSAGLCPSDSALAAAGARRAYRW